MGKSNLPILSERTLASMAESAALRVLGTAAVHPLGWEVSTRDAAVLVLALATAAIAAIVRYLFFRTNLGTAMHAAGGHAQVIRGLGGIVGDMIDLGLGVSD